MKNEDASSEGGEWKNSEIELILLRQTKFFLVFFFIFISVFTRGPLRFPVKFGEEAFRFDLAFEELRLSKIKQKQKVIQHPKTTSERENALNS